MSELTRRKVLAALSFAAAGCCASLAEMQFSSWNASTNSNFLLPAKGRGLFEEVPSTISGINWRHVNGRSQQYYLPETTGAGCAFLDYDNDGWMDIYLVNSRKCDFFAPDPPLRNALYHNNRDGTFSDVTERAAIRWSVNLKCAPGSSTFGIWQPTHRSFATGHVLLAAPVERGLATAP